MFWAPGLARRALVYSKTARSKSLATSARSPAITALPVVVAQPLASAHQSHRPTARVFPSRSAFRRSGIGDLRASRNGKFELLIGQSGVLLEVGKLECGPAALLFGNGQGLET